VNPGTASGRRAKQPESIKKGYTAKKKKDPSESEGGIQKEYKQNAGAGGRDQHYHLLGTRTRAL